MLATGRWVSTARLAMALTAMGCEVRMVCLGTHPALVTGVVRKHYEYKPLRPLAGIGAAIADAQPTVVLPVDELAVWHLEEMAAGGDERVRELVEGSLGGMGVLAVGRSRMALMELAVAEGVAVPRSVGVGVSGDVEGAVERLGLPMVMKADSSSGGRGVRVVRTAGEARKAWVGLRYPAGLLRVARRAVKWKEYTHLRPLLKRVRWDVCAQEFVAGGVERTAMAVAARGEVKALVCMEVVKAWAERGPSSVVRVVDDAVMSDAIRRVVGRLGMSGFCGFDFMVGENGVPLLIEMNPRPTQLAHLALGAGRDLVAAYVRGVVGLSVGDRAAVTDREMIALFPQELERDGSGEMLGVAFHDVPWECPGLVRRAMKVVPEVVAGDERWRG